MKALGFEIAAPWRRNMRSRAQLVTSSMAASVTPSMELATRRATASEI
jgi:hypothetical protein